MAWNRGTVSAEEILGMKKEDLQSKLDSAATKDDLKSISDQQEAIGGTLNELKAALANLSKPAPEPVIPADPIDPVTQVLSDPTGFVRAATQGDRQAILQVQADLNETRARQNFPQAFMKYGAELMASAQAMSLEGRARQGFWENHITMFAGSKALKGESFEGGYPSLLGGSGYAASPNGEVKDETKGFTTDQVSWFKDHKVPIEKAAAYKWLADNKEQISAESLERAMKHVN
jgi:hypothetical protein